MMQEFLQFKKMITPTIIQILFWIGVVFCIIIGLISIVGGATSSHGGGLMVIGGLMWIVLGPFVVRIYCELLIVIFSINSNLSDIRKSLESRN